MFPDQLEAAFASCPVVYFPYGMCEPHGPHCAVGLDGLKAHGLACAAAREHGGIVAPADNWHIHELSGYAAWSATNIGEVPRAWLTSVPPWQHFKNVCYHLRAADALGFHAAILLTGHYGPNWKDLKTLVELVQPHVGTRLYALPDFEANTPGFPTDGAGGDHAGKVETSLLWALEPDCIDMSRLPGGEGNPPNFAMGPSAPQANRKSGEQMVRDEVRFLGEKARELQIEYSKVQPRHALQTFGDVEKLWREVVRPQLRNFQTMQLHWPDEPNVEPPSTSRWHANWPIPDYDDL